MTDALPPAPEAHTLSVSAAGHTPTDHGFDRRAVRAALLAAIPALLVYLRTLAPTIAAWDAGDFATAAYTFGIAHPPGYPLYTLLGFLFTHLVPLGDVGFRMNLLSAVCATAAVGLTAALAATICEDMWAGAVAGWLLAFSNAWWSQAVVAEVYALNGVFFAAIWLLLLRWRTYGVARSLFVAAFVFGLGLAHHLSIGMSAPAILILLVWSWRSAPIKWSWVPACAALLLIGPLLYFVILFRAHHDPAYNFGNPDGWPRFLYHVRAQTYYFRLVDIKSSIWLRRFLGVGHVVIDELGWAGTAAAAAGFLLLVRRNLVFAVCALAIVIAYAAYTAAYRIPDIRVYYLPVIIILSVCASVLVAALRARLRAGGTRPVLAGGIVVLAAVIPLSLGVRNWEANDYHHSRLTRQWVEALHRTATLDGTRPAKLFMLGDTDLFVGSYIHLVEKQFPRLMLYDQAGNLFEDFYHVLGKNGGRSIHTIQDGERWALESQVALTSKIPVYFDPHPGYDLPGVKFVQQGLLFRALPIEQADPDSAVDFWRYVPDWSHYTRPQDVDPEDRHVLANYHILRGLFAMTRRHNRAEAESHWNTAEAFAGDESDVYQNLSRFFIAIGESTRALAACRKVLELVPDEGDSYSNLADVELEMRDTTAAVTQYEKALAISGFLSSTQYLTLANIYKQQGDAERAVMFYRYALGVQPSNPLGWATLASAYVRLGDLPRAEYSNRKALQFDPGFAAAHGNLGFVYMNMNRPDLAERELLESAKLAPLEVQPRANLALLYADMKRPADAEHWWRETLKLAPTYPDAHFTLGTLAAQRGDVAAARREMQLELAAHPSNTKALGELGLLEANSGNLAAAVSLWERVLAVDPSDMRAHFNLGMFYQAHGATALAIPQLQAFLRALPSGAPADQARAALARMGAAPK